ncbi:MAG TPA: methyltransferase domain-containing protein [Kofleriaceae bacterium]|nr:methyltransferase domain-containing protein [Kofleriaceae bacterium]
MSQTRESYDAVAETYADKFEGELEDKHLDRALLDTFAELCRGAGPVYDLGCGPGHVTRYLAGRGALARGLDLSPEMVRIARARSPGLDFVAGSMTALEAADASWAGAVALYSIIHLDRDERRRAFREIARVLRPGGWLLVAFHVSSAEQPPGSSIHLESWLGASVDLTTYFLDPGEVLEDLREAGLALRARMDREPWSATEYPSRRCYALARRGNPA